MGMREKENQRGDTGREGAVGWRERMSRALDMPPDLIGRGSLVEIRGRGMMTVRGNGKILIYTPSEIAVELHDGILTVRGRRLVCTSYYVGALGIEGKIDEVIFGDASCASRGGERA